MGMALRWFPFWIQGIPLVVQDYVDSLSIHWIAHEMQHDEYQLRQIPILPGDTLIDLGANNGLVCTFLAKKYPECRILALEPRSDNYANLCATLLKNGIVNVYPYRLAIAGSERDAVIGGSTRASGGASIVPGWYADDPDAINILETCPTTTLDILFRRHNIQECRFLKCDIEGGEFEAFAQTTVLDRIDYMSMEVHNEPRYLPVDYQGFVNHVGERMRHPEHFVSFLS